MPCAPVFDGAWLGRRWLGRLNKLKRMLDVNGIMDSLTSKLQWSNRFDVHNAM